MEMSPARPHTPRCLRDAANNAPPRPKRQKVTAHTIEMAEHERTIRVNNAMIDEENRMKEIARLGWSAIKDPTFERPLYQQDFAKNFPFLKEFLLSTEYFEWLKVVNPARARTLWQQLEVHMEVHRVEVEARQRR